MLATIRFNAWYYLRYKLGRWLRQHRLLPPLPSLSEIMEKTLAANHEKLLADVQQNNALLQRLKSRRLKD